MKQKTYFSLRKIEDILKKEKSKKIFLVTGKTSFKKSGASNFLNKIFMNKDFKIIKFSSFSSNPKIQEIKKALKLFEKEDCEIIISIGGGSSIDVAKSVKLFSKKKVPLVTIPTTAGSGSESTHFIVYYIKKEKQSEGIPEITFPDYVILDFRLLKSLPEKIMASSGIDALGQAIESYWSIYSTPKSRRYSRKAIRILIRHLEFAVKNKDKESLKKIQIAANLSGKAINISKTTACHAISYPFTSYFKIPHGHAVGLTLGEMLKFNYGVSKKNCLDKRGAKKVKRRILKISHLVGSKNPNEAGDKIYFLMKSIGLENKLSKMGITEKDLDIVVRKGFNPKRMNNNPRKMTKENLIKMLNKLY